MTRPVQCLQLGCRYQAKTAGGWCGVHDPDRPRCAAFWGKQSHRPGRRCPNRPTDGDLCKYHARLRGRGPNTRKRRLTEVIAAAERCSAEGWVGKRHKKRLRDALAAL